LKVAGLDADLDAIWTMPWRAGMPNGAYQQDLEWHYFDPPINKIKDHKAHAMKSITQAPSAWLPQLAAKYCELGHMSDLAMENLVLVDDQRLNFQSDDNLRVLRYCQVARYDAAYHDFGVLTDMGGIGAHDDQDYRILQRFVDEPWSFNEEIKVMCKEMFDPCCSGQVPVKLVVFDFDETLTIATFVPECEDFHSNIEWASGKDTAGWSQFDLVRYNFESPWVKGRRLLKLRNLFRKLIKPNDEERRAIAVLTENSAGAIAVLNLLKVAGLDQYISVLWAIPGADADLSGPHGVYQEGKGEWRAFDPPMGEVNCNKADLLKHLTDNPGKWLPQLAVHRKGSDTRMPEGMLDLCPENVVLVDDERLTHRTDTADGAPLSMRLCRIAVYDDQYRDCGMLAAMGGIGSHTDEDYELLQQFCDNPSHFPREKAQEAACVRQQAMSVCMRERIPTMTRQRFETDEAEALVTATRTGRKRGTTAYFPHDLDDDGVSEVPTEGLSPQELSVTCPA